MILYHYCSNETLVRMLEAKELRLSDLSLSNDSLEGRWVHHVLEAQCLARNIDILDRNVLLENFSGAVAGFGGLGFCMSTCDDMLSQWRGYADNGGGVSVGFEKERLDALCVETNKDKNNSGQLSLLQVEYDEARQKTSVNTMLDALLKCVEDGAFRRSTLLTPISEEDEKKYAEARKNFYLSAIRFARLLYSLKNPAFLEEKEWRMLSYFLRYKDFNGFDNLEYRASADRISPFKKISLDISLIKEIVLGPRNITPKIILEGLLQKAGCKDVVVRNSDVPPVTVADVGQVFRGFGLVSFCR